MKKSEMVICLGFLFKGYPNSQLDVRGTVERYYQAFGWIDKDVFSFLVMDYMDKKTKYFPSVFEFNALICEEREKAKRILEDPRNAYYEKISPEAAGRRASKLRRAEYILKALSAEERKFIKQ